MSSSDGTHTEIKYPEMYSNDGVPGFLNLGPWTGAEFQVSLLSRLRDSWTTDTHLLAMLPRVFSVMVTQRRSGFESRNIRFEGPSSYM
jgi:hypothetical protein